MSQVFLQGLYFKDDGDGSEQDYEELRVVSRQQAADPLAWAAPMMKQHYDALHRPVDFKVGKKVMLRIAQSLGNPRNPGNPPKNWERHLMIFRFGKDPRFSSPEEQEILRKIPWWKSKLVFMVGGMPMPNKLPPILVLLEFAGQ